MRPRRTPSTERTLSLEGGNEDNDLWVHVEEWDRGEGPNGGRLIERTFESTWELSPAEREQIAQGHNVKLIVWASGHPPVALEVTDEPLGKGGGEGGSP